MTSICALIDAACTLHHNVLIAGDWEEHAILLHNHLLWLYQTRAQRWAQLRTLEVILTVCVRFADLGPNQQHTVCSCAQHRHFIVLAAMCHVAAQSGVALALHRCMLCDSTCGHVNVMLGSLVPHATRVNVLSHVALSVLPDSPIAN